jgi:hypothetical protein
LARVIEQDTLFGVLKTCVLYVVEVSGLVGQEQLARYLRCAIVVAEYTSRVVPRMFASAIDQAMSLGDYPAGTSRVLVKMVRRVYELVAFAVSAPIVVFYIGLIPTLALEGLVFGILLELALKAFYDEGFAEAR